MPKCPPLPFERTSRNVTAWIAGIYMTIFTPEAGGTLYQTQNTVQNFFSGLRVAKEDKHTNLKRGRTIKAERAQQSAAVGTFQFSVFFLFSMHLMDLLRSSLQTPIARNIHPGTPFPKCRPILVKIYHTLECLNVPQLIPVSDLPDVINGRHLNGAFPQVRAPLLLRHFHLPGSGHLPRRSGICLLN